ncbi:hypothetical protein N9747_10675, partial [Planktomarina sp.]|nr:hypothetical protein [Planktomarina sp.]
MQMKFNLVQQTGASNHQVAYAAFNSNAIYDQKANFRAVTQTTPKNTWVDHLKRIQTDQDQQAFAELFRYFAPR